MSNSSSRLIDRWFPCPAVDKAVTTPEGSGRSEKAIFTWFASRPIAQARAAVLTALLPDGEEFHDLVEASILRSDVEAMRTLGKQIRSHYPEGRPILLDCFSGRGIIPLEAARLGVRAVGLDYSPVATLAGRVLADYPFRNWDSEPRLPFDDDQESGQLLDGDPRLLRDVRILLKEIGKRVEEAMEPNYPRNADGTFPWGYLWAITIPCDGCKRRFPLVGSLVLRHPYTRTKDAGQSFEVITRGDSWHVEIHDGLPLGTATVGTASGKQGKSARCPFCKQSHTLDTLKSKGGAGEYEDAPLLAAILEGANKRFRLLTPQEVKSALNVPDPDEGFSQGITAVPSELIPPGNEDTVRSSGYGYRTYGELMNRRQSLHFAETVKAIRKTHAEMIASGLSPEYSSALASYGAANLVRRLRRSTRGAKLLAHGNPEGTGQNRVQAHDVFADESKVSFQFDYIETGPGEGPGTWSSISETGLQSLARLLRGPLPLPAMIRQGSALSLPYRDGTLDAVVTDPPYYNMIDYCDASDFFFVWLKRTLFDIIPDLFGDMAVPGGLQDKTEEIIVKRGSAPGEHRTRDFYESSLSRAFSEVKRVLRDDGVLVVVFGHSDPDAWKRLLAALHGAGFVVTSAWPSRTESANTGVASIKVTISIGCRVAPLRRPIATAGQVDREVRDEVKIRVKQWEKNGLALQDQLMAAYGPAMEVYGRYASVLRPDNEEAPIEHYLSLARSAVRESVALKIESIPIENFDSVTRFALFWLRLYGKTQVPKGEARFLAQADNLRLEEVRGGVLAEMKGGYRVTFEPPAEVTNSSPVFDVVRAMISAWGNGSEGVAQILSATERARDDEQIWAVIAELSRLLPQSDKEVVALSAIQRNADSIKKLVGEAVTERKRTEIVQPELTSTEETS